MTLIVNNDKIHIIICKFRRKLRGVIMRKKGLGIFASAVAAAVLASGLAVDAKGGTWIKDDYGWWYQKADGSYAKSEWEEGYWLDAAGYNSYAPYAEWKQDAIGWYYQDSSGWYEQNNWEYIDDSCYHFDSKGYMCASEYVDGYWLNADGTWTYAPKASWAKDGTGWYYIDTAGYYPANTTVKIDEVWYTFDENGYLEEYTVISPKQGSTAKVDFEVTNDNKSTAAKNMSSLLGTITANGAKKTVKVDGENKTLENKNGTIYIDDETLDSYVTNKVKSTETTVTFEIDTNAKNIFSGIKLAGSSSYTYDVTVNGVTFNDIRVSGGWVTFKADGKSYKADVVDGSLYVKGNVQNANWVSAFKNAGIIESSTPVVDHK